MAFYSGEGGLSSNTVIISSDRILPVPARTKHNRNNSANGYDHCIPASTFLPFSGVLSLETATFLRFPDGNPRIREPMLVFIFQINKYESKANEFH
jgi:hypothetical protein